MRSKGIGRQGFVGALLMSSALVTVGVVLPAMTKDAAAQTSATQGRQFNIQPQSLQNALTIFGQQAGIQVSVDAAAARGVSSPGVSGSMSPEAAIARLLAGTGLNYRFTSPTTVLIGSAGAQGGNVSADGSTVLETITVRGQGATTEGTGSYSADESTIGKTSESLRETPQSVSVITTQQIRDKGMTTLTDALEAAPGITVTPDEYYGAGRYFSRGFEITNMRVDSGAVGVTSAYDAISSTSLAKYDRVEVLRGPARFNPRNMLPADRAGPVRSHPASPEPTSPRCRPDPATLQAQRPSPSGNRWRGPDTCPRALAG